ncbi:MAG TPA: methyltransferase domain-containing protein [Bryobacteraceae bacterium]|nr:methyltransferase domain-containing protein [Bryobacteraceae bacterium]
MTDQQIREQIEALGPWFYEFDLGGGRRTPSALPPEVLPIHQTRLGMVMGAVKGHFGARLPQIRAIDVGCHEGYYSVALAREGVRSVLGVDVREANLARARFVGETLGLENVEFRQGDCEDLRVEDTGEFELCLFLGLLYHLENPMRCLRNIGRVTREVCVIETQVIDEVEGAAEWGWREWTRPYQGVLALIDESGEFYNENTEAGASPIATCPSPRALEFMLKQAGFRRVETIAPPAGAYEQHARAKRVVAVAYK